ncbi:DEAD/DEAH box helicase [Spirochaeta africana]|uniref:DNA 3'-5' helicase n=1 Tax=Spirochaeta africana (strain ATCC 700263 / DSM 8902 / Z-7692) TaxID=889378 RepID=H9UIV4_SPIAZ|nr:DEAD/DEAH box helicase [Spirochaeta africana]AFG37447.1 superfamily II DNA helicase [Spirochaeta africana DSM 8902]
MRPKEIPASSQLSPPDPVVHWARTQAGIPFLFPVQRLVIAGILDALASEDPEPRGQIAVLPTGAGKSLCFQAPAALDGRPTLVLYPLLALLQDQKRRFDELGIPAAVVRGGQSSADRREIWDGVRAGRIRAVLSNPETMVQPGTLRTIAGLGFVHLVVDESHCVCEWGKTFRPDYLRIPEIRRAAGIRVISAFTATAGPQVLTAIQEHLFPDCSPARLLGSPDRPNMGITVLPVLQKDVAIRQMLSDPGRLHGRSDLPLWAPGAALPRPAIVFCSSRAGCRELALRLYADHPGKVRFYHAGLERSEKDRIEHWFFDSPDGILVSTNAYGMAVVSYMFN